MCYGYFWGGGMWIFPIIMLVIMLTVIYLIGGRERFFPFWYYYDRHQNHGSSTNALHILKQRYAKGEVNKEEFERIKKDII